MSQTISPADTSPAWKQGESKLLLTGTVYGPDGRTPASGVLLYYYHTNSAGRYEHRPAEQRSMPPNHLGQTHGYIRGWVRTNSNGRYSIYTIRPGTYPSRDEPAHVHLTVKEPNGLSEYYLDDFVFDDDPLLTAARRRKMENRGGSGVLRLYSRGDLQVGERDLYLGLHIPDYPVKSKEGTTSGREVGEDVLSFSPNHAWGPDKGTRTCPVCKYGLNTGILYFVGNHPDWQETARWLSFLEKESRRRGRLLKVYFIYGNTDGFTPQRRQAELEALGRQLQLEKLALTYVPSFTDQRSEVYLNRINPSVRNTFLVYKRSRIIAKFVNLPADTSSFRQISERLDQSKDADEGRTDSRSSYIPECWKKRTRIIPLYQPLNYSQQIPIVCWLPSK
jgi:protocatechuate 3,4-dioxygenase beta subunit